MSLAFLPPAFKVLRRMRTLENFDDAFLERMCRRMYTGERPHHLRAHVLAERNEAWLAGNGLILTETVDHPIGRELFLYCVVGSGILRQVGDIMSDLKALAEHKGCNRIGAEGLPRGWMRVGPPLGFRPVATRYMMELN